MIAASSLEYSTHCREARDTDRVAEWWTRSLGECFSLSPQSRSAPYACRSLAVQRMAHHRTRAALVAAICPRAARPRDWPAPRTEAPTPRTEAPTPRTEAPTPRTEAPTPRTEARRAPRRVVAQVPRVSQALQPATPAQPIPYSTSSASSSRVSLRSRPCRVIQKASVAISVLERSATALDCEAPTRFVKR